MKNKVFEENWWGVFILGEILHFMLSQSTLRGGGVEVPESRNIGLKTVRYADGPPPIKGKTNR